MFQLCGLYSERHFHNIICSEYPLWEWIVCSKLIINTLRTRQNGRYFADDTLKLIFLNENVLISKFVPKGPINNIPALVQIMAWRRPGDKPLSEPVMVRLLTHIYVTRPQWVNAEDLHAHQNRTSTALCDKKMGDMLALNHARCLCGYGSPPSYEWFYHIGANPSTILRIVYCR